MGLMIPQWELCWEVSMETIHNINSWNGTELCFWSTLKYQKHLWWEAFKSFKWSHALYFYAKVFIFLRLQRHMAKSLNNYHCVIAGAVIIGSVARFNVFQAKKILHLLTHKMPLHSFMSISCETEILLWLLSKSDANFSTEPWFCFQEKWLEMFSIRKLPDLPLLKTPLCSLEGRKIIASPTNVFLPLEKKEKKVIRKKDTLFLLPDEGEVQVSRLVGISANCDSSVWIQWNNHV